MRDHPEWDLVIGQAFDLQARNGSAEEQLSRWAALGREREGVVFWVWSWPGQTGIRAAYRSAYEKAGGRHQ